MMWDNVYFLAGRLPPLFFSAVFLLGAYAYIARHRFAGTAPLWLRYSVLIRSAIVFRIVYAALLTFLQYRVWATMGEVGKLFLNTSAHSINPGPFMGMLSWVFDGKLGYFLYYSYGRFWLSTILSIGIAWIFSRVLIALRNYNGRFFEEGEIELGFLMALVVGWPYFVIFIPLVGICVALFASVRTGIMRETYTTLGLPFIIAAAVCLLWGAKLLALVNGGVLAV